MYRVALTGGIASGKTAASDHFARLGIEVLDADRISRDLVVPGQPALTQIAQVFGADILQENGQLDRRALRERVFANPQQRQQLEQILHPLIRLQMQEQSAKAHSAYVVLVIPLYAEHQQSYPCERVLLIDAPETLQIERLRQRDGSNPEQITQILAAQAPRSARQALADDIILNNQGLQHLFKEVETLHQSYLSAALSQAYP